MNDHIEVRKSKYYAQKYPTIQKIVNELRTSSTTEQQLEPQNSSSSQQSITSNKRSYDSRSTDKRESQQRNDMNKKLRNSRGVSTPSLKLSASTATPQSPTDKDTSLSQHTQQPSRTSSGSSKEWTRSQTEEQQLQIMKYWLNRYCKNNKLDPTVSDLKSGKPWNEIKGRLLTQFMPVFKSYLRHNCISLREIEFYYIFLAALKDMHGDATKKQYD